MSESVEMYLISIARIAETTREEIVPIPMLAEKLDILPVSTNQMIRKLEESGLVRYLPYKGVQLTEQGQKNAAQVLRHHQLWEIFMRDYLNFPGEAAESLACRLEHILSNDEIKHLAAFLADPGAPGKNSLPQSASGSHELIREACLSELRIDQCAAVTRITADQAALSFLSAAGMCAGVLVTVLARGEAGDMLVRVGDQDRVHLSSELAAQIWLRKD